MPGDTACACAPVPRRASRARMDKVGEWRIRNSIRMFFRRDGPRRGDGVKLVETALSV